MEFVEFTAGENDSGRRLDRVLSILLKDRAAKGGANIFSALRKRLILLNGSKALGSDRVRCGDRIKIAAFLIKNEIEGQGSPATPSTGCRATAFSLEKATLFKNGFVMVINKPYGISVQPSSSQEASLSEIVAARCKTGTSLSFTPAPLHRLDKFTTGALVFSLSIDGARIFSKMMASSLIKKTYVGILQGKLPGKTEWKDGIYSRNDKEAPSFHRMQVTGAQSPEALEHNAALAVTKAEPLAYGKWNGAEVTLARFEIPTGKKHQIRAQSAFHGFPLLGDTAYGGTKQKGREFFLHAAQIEFPLENSLSLPQRIQAPLPAEFLNFLNSALINWDGTLII